MSQLALPLLTSTVLVLSSAIALYLWGRQLYRARDWLTIVGALIPLLGVWMLFMVGGFLQSLPVFREWGHVYLPADPGILALISAVTMLGMLIYALLFVWGRRLGNASLSSIAISRRPDQVAGLSLVILLAVDWYGRIQSITSGIYFRWAAQVFEESFSAAQSDPLILLLGMTGYAVLGLALYLRSRAKTRPRRWMFNALILIHSVLLIARGSRREALFILLVLGIVAAVEHVRGIEEWMKARSLARRLTVIGGAVVVFWVGVLVLPVARLSIRSAAARHINQPTKIISTFLFQELPERTLSAPAGDRGYNPARDLTGRITSYPSLAGAITQRQLLEGKERIGFDGFVQTAQIAVPSFLLSGPKVRPNAVLHANYTGISMVRDPHAHPVTSGIAYLGLPGIVVVLAMGGIIAGLLMGTLAPLGGIGIYAAVGLLRVVVPLADVGQYLASLRNAFLVIGLLYAVNAILALRRS